MDSRNRASQDVGSWHNESAGLFLVVGRRSVCWQAASCELLLFFIAHDGTILGYQRRHIFLRPWRGARKPGDAEKEEEEAVF
eukprot:1135542-Rhodomonas_salina.1